MHVYHHPYYLLLLGRFVLFSYILILYRYKNTVNLSIYELTENGLGVKRASRWSSFSISHFTFSVLIFHFSLSFFILNIFSVCFVIVFINPIEYMLLCSYFPALSCPVDFIILLFIYFPAAVISKNKLTWGSIIVFIRHLVPTWKQTAREREKKDWERKKNLQLNSAIYAKATTVFSLGNVGTVETWPRALYRFIKVPKRVTHLDQQRQKEEPFSKTLTFICTRFYRVPPLEPWVFLYIEYCGLYHILLWLGPELIDGRLICDAKATS